MTNPQPNALAPMALTAGINMNVDKNDIIAIKLSAAERSLNEDLKSAQARARTHEKEIKFKTTELAKLYAATLATTITPAVDTLKALAKEFDGFAITEPGYSEGQNGLTVSVSVVKDNYGNHRSISKLVPYDDAQKKLQEEVQAEKDKLKDVHAEIVEAKQRLAKMPTLERQYRAAIATAALSSTEQGLALLSQLESGDVKKDVLALPAS